jgi:LysM repeat protein
VSQARNFDRSAARTARSPVRGSSSLTHVCSPDRGVPQIEESTLVSASRCAVVLLPAWLASAILVSACGVAAKPSVFDTVSPKATLLVEPTITTTEESMPKIEPKSIPEHSAPAEDVSPKRKGTNHQVRRGQTLAQISRLYQVPIDTLMRVNGINKPSKLVTGTSIFIPLPSDSPHPYAPVGGALSWPLHGRITGDFGRRRARSHHEGIDIDGEAGDQINAAAAGTVTHTGARGKYGRMVLLDHGDGLATLYAHLSKIVVRIGDQIERGELIGTVGRSGNARGTHLHFEVHQNGARVDPLQYLQTDTLIAVSQR